MSNDQAEAGNCNVLVMSEAGKPVFARYGTEEEIARTCGLLQAIRTSIAGHSSLELGDIQSLRSGTTCIVFMTVGSLTLVAISRIGSRGEGETEAYLKLQLEYILAQIIFTMTEQVQQIFLHNPGFDLRTMLGTTDTLMHEILKEAGPDGHAGPFLTGGVESLFPVSHLVRERASRALSLIGNQTDNTIFALLIVGNKLLTIVQPFYRPHQIRTSDLHLILHFVRRQPGLSSSDLWIPMCLPRFNSSGFLYAYTSCLDHESKLTLILISQHSTTEQFELFRNAADKIRNELGIKKELGSVLKITESDLSGDRSLKSDISNGDVKWSRRDEVEGTLSSGSDNDYVDASGDGDKMIPYVDDEASFLSGIQRATDPSVVESLIAEYLEVASAMHFLFRIEVPLRNGSKLTSASKGSLNQCICPPLTFPFADEASRRRVWNMYQKLNLRLRLGSATVESTRDAFDMIESGETPGIGRYCPAMGLVESPPNVHGVSHVVDGSDVFLAMNGRGFELYMVTSNTTPIKQAANLGARLVRRILVDERQLFLSCPMTWKE